MVHFDEALRVIRFQYSEKSNDRGLMEQQRTFYGFNRPVSLEAKEEVKKKDGGGGAAVRSRHKVVWFKRSKPNNIATRRRWEYIAIDGNTNETQI